jgi:hypothetical protein
MLILSGPVELFDFECFIAFVVSSVVIVMGCEVSLLMCLLVILF